MADTDNKRTADRKRLERPVLHIARCVLEAVTPLSLSTGNPDGVFDTALVTDANDLPAIPGSSLAGVLRHLWRDTYGAETHDDTLFGFQERNFGDASRLIVSWGALLDSKGEAAEGLLPIEDPTRLDDTLFQRALTQLDEPLFRNRVRLSHRGAAADAGKFDRAVLPRGHRFAIELRLWSAAKDDPDWPRLLDLLAHPALRLGGATRAGLGRMRCVACHQASLNLSDEADAATFRGLDRALHATGSLAPYDPAMTAQPIVTGKLHLSPRGLWRIGQRTTDLRDDVAKPADLVPVTETVVEWDESDTPTIVDDRERLLLPASSLKGALAHRMSFHANRYADPPVWADDGPPTRERNEAVDALLGSVKDKGEEAGQAGALFIDDACIPVNAVDLKEVPHNSIDRFTGGVRNRVLYTELSVLGTPQPIEIDLTLDLCRLARNGADEAQVRRTLKATLDDLCQGRLALGSRTTTGNGFCVGRIDGDLRAWLDGDAHTRNANAEAA